MGHHIQNAVLEIIKAIFQVLQDGQPHSMQDLSYSTRHTVKAIKKCLVIIETIQKYSPITKEGTRYRLQNRELPESQ